MHKVASRVLYLSVGDLGLKGVGEFYVAKGIGGLFDLTGDAFIALAAQSNGPVYGRVPSDFRLPFFTDFRKVPANLTFADGVNLLEQEQQAMLAKNNSTSSSSPDKKIN